MGGVYITFPLVYQGYLTLQDIVRLMMYIRAREEVVGTSGHLVYELISMWHRAFP
jgi:hypothetical protein